MQITEQVHEIISEHLGVKLEEITPEKRFEEDFGADSLDMVELAMAFEEKFDIAEIPDDHRERIATVADAVKYVENAEKAQAANV